MSGREGKGEKAMGTRGTFCILIAAFLLGIGGLGACGNQPATVEGAITGADNQPVPGAQIAIYELEQVKGAETLSAFTKGAVVKTIDADNDGLYTVLLEPGDYVFEVTAVGWQLTSHMVEARAGQELTIDFRLSSP